ncbi:uncharacterized protein Dana_GF26891 [Drosophila ananassae]|uniref:Uncharacterized protein n=1 Tax=Drosophila ananassae TaxID=7217 RepID=A0A0P8YEZ8_DROAN|nr:uncharacterized protein Dana_GF26891 [Drosophila ananassae]
MGLRNLFKVVLLSAIIAASLGETANRYLTGVEVDIHNYFLCIKQKESQTPEGPLLSHPPSCDPFLDRLAYSWSQKRQGRPSKTKIN